MGSFLQPSCSCGFRPTGVSAGGSMSDFQDTCMAPALCKSCNELLELNILNKSSCCPKCRGPITYYNDSSLQEKLESQKPEDDHIFSWHMGTEEFILPRTRYYCPKCGKMNLEFEEVLLFD